MNRQQRRQHARQHGPEPTPLHSPAGQLVELNVQQALQVAVQYHQAGNLEAAEELYRQILEVDPSNSDATHLLGVIAHQVGQNEIAVEFVRVAIAANPNVSTFYCTLGTVLHELGGPDEAVAAFRRAIELAPDNADAHSNLGATLKALGRFDESETHLRQAVALAPTFAAAHNNLGATLKELGRPDEAVASLRRALELQPDYPEAHANLGSSLQDLGRTEEAIEWFGGALALRPVYPDVLNNLGVAFQTLGRLDEAIVTLRRAIELKPDFPVAMSNLANSLHKAGRVEEATAGYFRALELDPSQRLVHSNLLFTLLSSPHVSPGEVLAEHRRYGQVHRHPDSARPHANAPDPERRLRVGFVSPDFRQHAVMSLFQPLFENFDRERFELYCYSTNAQRDEVTGRLRAEADAFRDLASLSDDRAAATVRADRVDVLVDLACHTAGNRLGLFARKPAPVQVTHNVMTTGLDAVDYLISDRHLAPDLPPGAIAERLWRLPDVHMCWAPPADAPPVAPPPALAGGHVTFGSFNNLAKLGDPVLRLWARVLAAVPDSRLLLKGSGAADATAREQVANRLAACGLDPSRVELLPRADRPEDHLAAYGRVDIGLDPFPFNGCTTTCEALWMGVPVVTLPGTLFADRVGVAFLNAVGLPELIGEDSDAYVEIAARLAADLPRLAALRAGLRERMAASPLCDGPAYADAFGEALRAMWRAWCARQQAAA